MTTASSECEQTASVNKRIDRTSSHNDGAAWIPMSRPAYINIGGIRKVGIPVVVITEEDSTFSIITPSLPGACAQGDTLREAREAIREVLVDALRASRRRGESHPFRDHRDLLEKGDVETIWLDD